MGGSSKKVTVGYKYYLGMHMILCHGPADKLIRVLVDKRSAWSGASTGGQININAENLFGGESREGGISGAVDVEMGGPSQGQNSYLLSKIGSDIPSFRGVLGVVLRQVYVGINPYLKAWAFRVQRIHKRQNGIPQWYDEKAEIKSNEYLQVENEVLYDSIYLAADVYNGPPSADGRFLPISGLDASGMLKVEVLDGAWSRWASDTFNGGRAWTCGFHLTKEDGSSVGFYDDDSFSSAHYFPTASQAESYVATQSPATITGSASYKLHFADWAINENRGGLTFRISYSGLLAIGDMNPAHIIRECLTDPDWGMGYQESDIDDAAFQTAADQLYAEAMGISLLWDRQVPIESFIQEVIKHIDGALYVSRSTGKFVLKLIRSDYDENTLLELDPSNVEKIDNPARPTFGELTNSVTVNYWDSATGKDASVTVQDTAMIQMQGAVINTTVQYPGFTNFNIASRVSQRDLRALSSALLTCTIYANQDAKGLNIGDVFKLTWPDFEIDGLVMRVVGLAFGDGKSNTVRITAAQDVFALPETGVVTQPDEGWVDPVTDAIPAEYRIVEESPYYELVQRLGQTSTDEQLATNPDIGYLLASAARPGTAINGRLAVDAGGGYEGNDTPMDFCPAAFLAENLTPGATSVAITGGDALSEVAVGTHAQIGAELVKITSVSDSSLGIGRGVLDTVPAAHPSGTAVLFWDAFADSDGVEYVAGETIQAKILPTTGLGTLDLADAPEDSLTFTSRAFRPYPPGNVKIGGVAYPATIAGAAQLALTWAHRDRLQQTGGDLVDTTEGNIGPEAGTTYTLRLYGETDTLLRTETGLAGTSYTWTAEEADSGLTVPGATGGDPYWSTRVALLHFNGADASTTFVDEKGHPFTAVGNAQIDTAQSLFGGASLLLDGAGDYIWAADSADWDFGTGDFTVQIAIRFNALPGSGAMTLCGTYGGSSSGWSLQFRNDGGGGNRLRFSVEGDTGFDFAWSPATGTWYKIEVNRSGTSLRAFVGGTQIGSTQTSGHNISSAAPLWVGGLNSGSGVQWFNGWFDELRITKGRAEHTANYTPDAAPFPGSGPARLNGRIRFELESVRDGLVSFQHHNISVDRTGWGYNWGKYWGGPAP